MNQSEMPQHSWHVVPVNDLKVHNTLSDHCQCLPRVERQQSGSNVVVHNSYDGREFFEKSKEENGQ